MNLEIEAAYAKTHKYASRESGDTVDVIERPNGGLTLVLIDGQGSGRGARTLSQMLVARASMMIRDGVRDGAVGRALNDILLTQRQGQVSATMDMVSVDLAAGEVVMSRQGGTVGLVRLGEAVELLPGEPVPLGRYRSRRPQISQYPIEDGVTVIVTSDGVSAAGSRNGGAAFDLPGFAGALPADLPADALADAVLAEALRRDDQRPADDLAVGVIRLVDRETIPPVRRLSLRLPTG